MDRTAISNWVRQARYRAKKYDVYSNLEVEIIEEIIDYYSGKCVYCDDKAEALDHPFPLRDFAPNISSNTVPICKQCKKRKKSQNLSWMFNNGHISNELYIKLIGEMLSRDDSDRLKNHIKKAIGIFDE